jgi:mannose-1-phosphate guanylyltransferase
MLEQFLDVLGIGKSLLQMTFERLTNVAPAENIFIVTNHGYVDLVKEQLPTINSSRILTEPRRKNTAPCIAYAAAKIFDLNPDATLVVAPSDHLILKEEKFTSIVNIAIEQAKSESVNLILDVIFVDTNKDTSNSTYPFDKKFDGILNFFEFFKNGVSTNVSTVLLI